MAHILVIEDNQANLELMTYLLTAFKHTVVTATDGVSGLDAALEARPDLIICDIQLPDLDGYAVAQRLKADPALQTVPLVAVTAFAMVGDRDQILAVGFDGYLAKPIVPETFVTQVEAFLDPAQRSALRPAAVAASELEAPEPWAVARATILVVDDQPFNRDLLRSILEPNGFSVITVTSVAEAIEQAHKHVPDLVISDLHMPDLSGFDLIRAFQNDPQLRTARIVIHSATRKSEIERHEAILLGATAFISRPLEPQIILTEIEACLQVAPEQDNGHDPDS